MKKSWMMALSFLAAWIVALAASTVCGQDGPDASIPQLAALGNYAGDWDVKMQINDVTVTGTCTGKWVLGGRFLEQSASLPSQGEFAGLQTKSLMTYDPQKRKYVTWTFDSGGNGRQMDATWNADAKTMTSVGADADGGRTTITADFSKENVENWRIAIATASGQPLIELKGTNTRR